LSKINHHGSMFYSTSCETDEMQGMLAPGVVELKERRKSDL
jgi:hypothetical protein